MQKILKNKVALAAVGIILVLALLSAVGVLPSPADLSPVETPEGSD